MSKNGALTNQYAGSVLRPDIHCFRVFKAITRYDPSGFSPRGIILVSRSSRSGAGIGHRIPIYTGARLEKGEPEQGPFKRRVPDQVTRLYSIVPDKVPRLESIEPDQDPRLYGIVPDQDPRLYGIVPDQDPGYMALCLIRTQVR